MGVGGGGPGLASVGVEGREGELGVEDGGDGEAAVSQVSAMGGAGLGLVGDEMVRFLREDSSPCAGSVSLRGEDWVFFTGRSARLVCHCRFRMRGLDDTEFDNRFCIYIGRNAKETAINRGRVLEKHARM